MYKSRGILLAVGILSLVACSQAFEGGFPFARTTYDSLNGYLEAVKPADPEAAIQQLTQLLHEEEEKAKKPLTFNNLRIKALGQLTELASIADYSHPTCDESAIQILAKNSQAVGGISSKVNADAGTLRPIDDLVVYFSLQHAKACQNVYPDLLKAKYENLNRANLHHVESLLNGLVKSRVEKDQAKHPEETASKAIYSTFVARRQLVDSKKDSVAVFEALKEESKNNPENKYLGFGEDERIDLRYLHDQSAKHLLQKYLIQPCKYYQKELGQSLFEPALYDISLHPIITDDKVEFYYALARYELCASIISLPKSITKSVQHLSELKPCEDCDEDESD